MTMSMRLHCARRFPFCVAVVLFWSSVALARDYYVSTAGSDANPGTIAQPFLTIQKAASVMVAGDTAYIRAGVYRETVRPVSSGAPGAPITFQPYNGESVIVSGADVIPTSSWSLSNGSIYKAPMACDLGEGANQIFLDGQMMIEARWPNTTLDISHPIVSLTGGGSYVNGAPGLSTGTINFVPMENGSPINPTSRVISKFMCNRFPARRASSRSPRRAALKCAGDETAFRLMVNGS